MQKKWRNGRVKEVAEENVGRNLEDE